MMNPLEATQRAIDLLKEEHYPRSSELISGAEMFASLLEYFEAEEIFPLEFPIDWFTRALETDDLDWLVMAGLANGICFLGCRDVRHHFIGDEMFDFVYHTYAVLRIRIECRHAELLGGHSPYRFSIN